MADFSINAEITANSKGFKAGLAEAQSSLKGFGESLKKTIVAVGSFTVALQGISKVSKFASEATKEFAKANSAIVKGTGATGSALAELSNNVRNIMREGIGLSASEVGEMVADLNTRFGATGKGLEKLVDEFDKFSAVTGVDTKQSIESLADVMAKWNISTEESNSLMDQLVYASQASGLSVTELTSALKNGQTTFDAFGMSVTESIGFLSQLKTQGVDTTAALSALKIGMAKFASEGGDVSEQFNLVAKRIQNAKTESEALQIAVSNFGAKGGAELVKVFKNNGLDNFISQLENAEGTLARTEEASRTSADALADLKAQIQATFFSGETDSYLKQIIDEIKIGFTEIDSDTMYDVFNNIYKAVQICVNSIDAIIHGDWETVWDYAKLVVLKIVDGITEGLSKMVDDLGLKVNLAAGIIGGLATGFGILTGNIPAIVAGVGTAVGAVLATNAAATQKIGEDVKTKIDAIEKDIIARTKKNTQNGSQQLLKDLKKTQNDIKAQAEETVTVIEENLTPSTLSTKNNFFTRFAKDAKGAFTAINKIVKDSVEKTKAAFTDTVDEEERQAEREKDIAESTAKMKNDLINGVSQTYGSMFSMLGQEMVKGEAGWEDYAAVAVQGVAQVLQALGSELLALSAVRAAHYDFGTAAVAATAATAAFVASGVLTAVSSAMKSTAETTDSAVSSLDNWESSIDSLHDTITDLVESAVEFNGFITAVTQANDMIAAATSNYEKAIKQYENFAAELTVLEGIIEIQNFSLFGGGGNWWDKLSHLQQIYLLSEQKKLQDQLNMTAMAIEQAKKIIDAAIDTITGSVAEQNEELREQEELIKEIYSGEWLGVGKVITKQQQLLHLNESLVSTLADFVNFGADIGDALLDSLNDSLSSTEFLSTIKKTIRTNLLKIAVYTDEMREKLAKVGTKLAAALSGQTSLTEVRSELNAIWEEAAKNAEKAEKIINEAFGDIADDIDDATEEITDALTTFEDAMQNFFTSIKDTGASIADEIVNGLTNGLSQSDFLSKMQTWLRNNLIQMVVYTDSMKSEIQAISDKIAEIMGSGRMFTTDELHEIRRDLSYAYESATARMGTIDEILNSVFSGYATETQNATALGATIGTTIIGGLENGLGSVDFLNNMKKIIRSNLLKVAVYTESFQDRLASVGVKLASALSGKSSLTNITVELQELWDIASENAKKAEKIIEEAFGSTQDIIDDSANGIEDSINGVEEVLTRFEQAMQNFFTSIKDTGASIANEIVNGLTNGLSQSDFLSKMQTWLRNNLIQMVVYTDSMKGEIQAISNKIAEIMGSGRMFTTDELHEIRRDLSYAYESATNRMGTIDEILSSVFSGYATGTQSATTGLHLVGEAGPELVRFRGGEQVFNANDTKDILSGGNMGNNFNVTFVNTQDTTAMAMMNQLRQYNRELAINGIL